MFKETRLTVCILGMPRQAAFDAQIAAFAERNAGVAVEMVRLEVDEFIAREVGGRSGPPDVIAAPADVLLMLLPLLARPTLSDTARADFHPGGLANLSPGDDLVATPWFMFGPGCSPFFAGLAVHDKAPYPEAARALIDFLTDVDQQIALHKDSDGQLLPARMAGQAQVNVVSCPDAGLVVPLPPEDRVKAIRIAEERAPLLQEVLERNSAALREKGLLAEDQAFHTSWSNAVLDYRALGLKGTMEFADAPPQAPMRSVLTPVAINFTADAFRKALQPPHGVMVGAFFGVDEPLVLELDQDGAIEIAPGQTRGLKWRGYDPADIEVILVDPAGTEYPAGRSRLAPTGAIGGPPFFTVEIGSCSVRCRIGGFVWTAAIPNGSVGGYVNFIVGIGGAILSRSC